MEKSTHDWNPSTWRTRNAAQSVDLARRGAPRARRGRRWPRKPPLVFAGEARRLLEHLELVAHGKSFLLQAGDCAESFDEGSADSIRDKLKVILQMAVALTYAAGVPVIKVGRIAGQFAKPRTDEFEERDGAAIAGLSRPHRQRRGVRRDRRGDPTPSACSPPTTRASRR